MKVNLLHLAPSRAKRGKPIEVDKQVAERVSLGAGGGFVGPRKLKEKGGGGGGEVGKPQSGGN